MTCVTLQEYDQACGAVTGGISDILIFDPFDINFTQGAAVAGVLPPYTAVAIQADATPVAGTDQVFFPISFEIDEAEYQWTQSKKGCSTKYTHEFDFSLAGNSQKMTNFLQSLDSAGCCCGIGVAVRLNSGKILIAGERWVTNAQILRFTLAQDGSKGTSGKVYDDENVGNIVIKGDYSRPLYEYTGTWASLLALNDAP